MPPGVNPTAVNKHIIRKVDTPDELLAHTLDAATSIKRREDKLRRTTRVPRIRGGKCAETGGGDFRTSIVNCSKFVISV